MTQKMQGVMHLHRGFTQYGRRGDTDIFNLYTYTFKKKTQKT